MAEAAQGGGRGPLSGLPILFLGSSITYGYRSGGVSFVELLQQRTGLLPRKDAVSGTALAQAEGDGGRSYWARLQKWGAQDGVACLVCQLSSNDAFLGRALGDIAPGFAPGSFDTRTVTGAIEAIVCYARRTWGCPVLFFTSPRYASAPYAAMVARLLALQKKWAFGVLDLWNDEEMNAVREEDRARYMADDVHPTLTGYRDWWTPKFEAFLSAQLSPAGSAAGRAQP